MSEKKDEWQIGKELGDKFREVIKPKCLQCGFSTRKLEDGYPCNKCLDYDRFRPEGEWKYYKKP